MCRHTSVRDEPEGLGGSQAGGSEEILNEVVSSNEEPQDVEGFFLFGKFNSSRFAWLSERFMFLFVTTHGDHP